MIIRPILAAGLSLAVVACITPAVAETDCGGERCVAVGERFDAGGATITPLEVLEDSRCPIDTQCVWAGQIRILALVERDGREREIELTGGQIAPILSGNLEFTQAWPMASASAGAIAPEAYRFHFSWTPILLDAQR